MKLRLLIRSLIFLSTGVLAGLGFRQCRPVATIAPGASPHMIPAAAESGASSPAIPAATLSDTSPPAIPAATTPASTPDPSKIHVAARSWFDAHKPPPSFFDVYARIESKPSREIDRIETLTSADCRDWLEEGRANGAPPRLMDMLMERWGEVEMPAFVAWIEFLALQIRPPADDLEGIAFPETATYHDQNSLWFGAACNVLKRMDPAAKIPPGPLGQSPSKEPADLRPPPSLADLASLPPDEVVRELVRRDFPITVRRNFIDQMLEKDHRATLVWAQALPKILPDRLFAMKRALRWGVRDRSWFLENIPLLKTESAIRETLSEAFNQSFEEHWADASGRWIPDYFWPKKSLPYLIDWVLQQTEPAVRRAALASLPRLLNSTEAADLLRRLPDRAERSFFLDEMFTRLGDDIKARELVQFIAAEPAGGKESMGAGVAAQHIATNISVERAIAWAGTLPADGRRAAALASAYSEWTRRDPDAALRAALALPPGDARSAVCTQIAITDSDRDAAAALHFSQTLGPEERAAIFPHLAEKLLSHHSAEARAEAVWILTRQPAVAEDSKFLKTVEKLLPDSSTPTGAQTAREWVNQLPEGPVRSSLEAKLTNQ